MWTPEESVLGQVKELQPFTFFISYIPDDPSPTEFFDVTATLAEPQTTVTITPVDDTVTIAGQFEEVFNYSLAYRQADATYIVRSKFNELPTGGNLIKYTADPRATKDFIINATATGNLGTVINKQYTITVENDWDIARLLLIEKVSEE